MEGKVQMDQTDRLMEKSPPQEVCVMSAVGVMWATGKDITSLLLRRAGVFVNPHVTNKLS